MKVFDKISQTWCRLVETVTDRSKEKVFMGDGGCA